MLLYREQKVWVTAKSPTFSWIVQIKNVWHCTSDIAANVCKIVSTRHFQGQDKLSNVKAWPGSILVHIISRGSCYIIVEQGYLNLGCQ